MKGNQQLQSTKCSTLHIYTYTSTHPILLLHIDSYSLRVHKMEFQVVPKTKHPKVEFHKKNKAFSFPLSCGLSTEYCLCGDDETFKENDTAYLLLTGNARSCLGAPACTYKALAGSALRHPDQSSMMARPLQGNGSVAETAGDRHMNSSVKSLQRGICASDTQGTLTWKSDGQPQQDLPMLDPSARLTLLMVYLKDGREGLKADRDTQLEEKFPDLPAKERLGAFLAQREETISEIVGTARGST